jgi:TolB-like protein
MYTTLNNGFPVTILSGTVWRCEVKQVIVILMLLLLAVLPSAAERSRIAVFDFTVRNLDPEYKNVGKGISELVAFELRKSPGVRLVSRNHVLSFTEKRNVSAVDLSDPTARILASEILDCGFMIIGQVEGTGNDFVFSIWLIESTSGEVVWNDELKATLSNFESFCASWVQSILIQLDAKVAKSTAEKAASRDSKDERVFVAFSNAVDSIDRRNEEQAERLLVQASELDPDDEVISRYLHRFDWSSDIVSPRFKVEPEMYTAAYNPAVLGFIEHDIVYFYNGKQLSTRDEVDAGPGEVQLLDVYQVREKSEHMRVGYMVPLGRRVGLGAEYIHGDYDQYILYPFFYTYEGVPVTELGSDMPRHFGGTLSVGYRFLADMSLGGSVLVWTSESTGGGSFRPALSESGVYFSVVGGYMMRALDRRLTFGASAAYCNQLERYFDYSQHEAEEGTRPLVLEASVSSAFLDRTLFASLAAAADIYIDGRGATVLRAVPVVEYWPIRFLAIRGGGEFSTMNRDDECVSGYGALGGVTVKIWRIELDANFTARKKPSRVLPGYLLSDWTLQLGAELDPSFISRKSEVGK